MKMVAAAKLKRAQDNAEKSRPYANKMKDIVLSLISKKTVRDRKIFLINMRSAYLIDLMTYAYYQKNHVYSL